MPELSDPSLIEQTIADLAAGRIVLEEDFPPGTSPISDLVCTGEDALRILLAQPHIEPDFMSDNLVFYGHITTDLAIPTNTILPFYAMVLTGPIDGNVTINGTIGDRYREPGVQTNATDLYIRRISGNLTINGTLRHFGTIIDHVAGDVTITGNAIGLHIKHVDGNLTVTQPAGIQSLSVGHVGGTASIDATTQRLNLKNIGGNTTITGKQQLAQIRHVDGDVVVEEPSQIEKLTVGSIAGHVRVAGQIGITLDGTQTTTYTRPLRFGRVTGNALITTSATIHGGFTHRQSLDGETVIEGDINIADRASITGDINIDHNAVLGNVIIDGQPQPQPSS